MTQRDLNIRPLARSRHQLLVRGQADKEREVKRGGGGVRRGKAHDRGGGVKGFFHNFLLISFLSKNAV